MGLAAQFSEDAVVRGNDRAIRAFRVCGAAIGAKEEGGIGAKGIKELVQVRTF